MVRNISKVLEFFKTLFLCLASNVDVSSTPHGSHWKLLIICFGQSQMIPVIHTYFTLSLLKLNGFRLRTYALRRAKLCQAATLGQITLALRYPSRLT